MNHSLKEIIRQDHQTNDTQYNKGLKKLQIYGVTYFDEDVRYYLYCNGIGCWTK